MQYQFIIMQNRTFSVYSNFRSVDRQPNEKFRFASPSDDVCMKHIDMSLFDFIKSHIHSFDFINHFVSSLNNSAKLIETTVKYNVLFNFNAFMIVHYYFIYSHTCKIWFVVVTILNLFSRRCFHSKTSSLFNHCSERVVRSSHRLVCSWRSVK